MSSYNKMMDTSLSTYRSRDALARESFLPSHAYARREIEMEWRCGGKRCASSANTGKRR